MAAITICSDFEVRIWVYIGWNEDFQEKNISNLRYADDITHGRKQRGIKEPLDEGKRREWKTGLKLNIQKVKIMASSLMTSQQIDEELVEIVADFIFLGSKITAIGDFSHEIKRHLLLGKKAMTNLGSILKSRGITLPTKIHTVKDMVFQQSCMVRVGQ